MTVVVSSRIDGRLQAALQRFERRARQEIGLRGEVTVLLTSASKMRALNHEFRKKNKPTDVLSFPAAALANGNHSGDIAICTDIARAQARRYGHSLEQELKILLLHGLLHLAGYDHEHDQGEMIRLERQLRLKLRLPESLTERGTATRRAACVRQS